MIDTVVNVNSGFYDAVSEDRVYSADDMNRPYHRVITEGVFATPQGTPSTDLKVIANTGLTVKVNIGEGLFAGKWFENPEIQTINVPANSGVTPRIDSVLVQIDKRQSGRVGSLVYRTGTAASSPSAPAINQTSNVYEYRLANVYVAAGASSINNANITDMRGSAECPWITSLIKQVDTSALFDQYKTAYETFYNDSTADFEDYTEQQRQAWADFISSLTEELDCTMNLVTLTNVAANVAGQQTISIGIASFDKTTDVLQVFVNGMLCASSRYTINEAGTAVTFSSAFPSGAKVDVEFVVLKSVIGGDISSTVSLIQALDSKVDAAVADSGWQYFTAENGAGRSGARYRKIGNVVYLKGAFSGCAFNTVFTHLPEGYRPSAEYMFASCAQSSGTVHGANIITINTDGGLRVSAGSVSGFVMIAGSFPI